MATTIRYSMDTLLASLEPGLSTLVISEFKNRLEEKMQNAVDEVFEEMQKELPDKIESKVKSVLLPAMNETRLNVVVDLYNSVLNNPYTKKEVDNKQ